PSGMNVGSFGLAVNDRYKDKDGNWVDKPNFVDCDIFGNRADAMARYLSKGSPVFIESSASSSGRTATATTGRSSRLSSTTSSSSAAAMAVGVRAAAAVGEAARGHLASRPRPTTTVSPSARTTSRSNPRAGLKPTIVTAASAP
ncbi:MAG: single-stranded DNA-binding protein, partial [Planctomycetota bacterium]